MLYLYSIVFILTNVCIVFSQCTKDIDCLGDSICTPQGECIPSETTFSDDNAENTTLSVHDQKPEDNTQEDIKQDILKTVNNAKAIYIKIESDKKWESILYKKDEKWLKVEAPCTLTVSPGKIVWKFIGETKGKRDVRIKTLHIEKSSVLSVSRSESTTGTGKRIGGIVLMGIGLTGMTLTYVNSMPETSLKLGLVGSILVGGFGGGLTALGGNMFSNSKSNTSELKIDIKHWKNAPQLAIKPFLYFKATKRSEETHRDVFWGTSLVVNW